MVVLSNVATPVEGIVHQENATTFFVNQQEIGTGTLYITENAVIWVSNSSSPALSLAYRDICVHAVQREPSPALYMQINYLLSFPSAPGSEQNVGGEGDNESDDDEVPVTQLRFVPQDEGTLQAMFQAMNDCQALHPDPEDEDSDYMEGEDEEEPDGGGGGGGDMETGSEEQSRRLESIHIGAHPNGNSHHNDDHEDQFADD